MISKYFTHTNYTKLKDHINCYSLLLLINLVKYGFRWKNILMFLGNK